MAVLRLDKFVASAAGATRGEARELIRRGRVTVGGLKVLSGDFKTEEGADVRLDGTRLNYRRYVYIMMNKPAGWLSATEDARDKTVLDLLPQEYRRLGLFCAGRLDKDSEGLLLLTNDGDFCHDIISPKKNIKKSYYIDLGKPFRPGAEELFASGMSLGDGTVCLPARLEILGGGLAARVVLSEGKHRQVRRMARAAGGEVKYLKRLAIGGLSLDESLPPGGFRELSGDEAELVFEGKRRPGSP